MYHLIYVSYATHPFTEDDLKALLISARRRNHQRTITGMLIHLNDRFIQVLEGEEEEVKKIMSTIEIDPRHKKISILLEGRTEERVFQNWTMGFKRLGEDEFKSISGFTNLDHFFSKENVTNDSSPLLIFLKLFYRKNMNDYTELV